MPSIRARTADMRRALALRSMFAAAVCLTACRSAVKGPIGAHRDVPVVRGGVLRTAGYTDVRTLDPVLSSDSPSATLEALIYDRLMTYDERGELTPQLASSVDVSEDGKRYVFTLRRGVLFHDGSELTAADVKRSLERALHSKTPCSFPGFFARVLGYGAYHSGAASELSGIRVHGKYVVGFELREVDPTFLHVLALPLAAPVCRSAGRVYTRSPAFTPCGTGPFRVRAFEQGQVARLVRHEGYWEKGKPYLDAIDWQLSMPHSTQRFKFERGELDYMRDFSDTDSLLFRTSPAWQGQGGWQSPLTTVGAFMNTELAPFDNRHVRRAVAFALDHAQVALLQFGHMQVHPRLVPKAILPDWPGMRVQHHDLARALEEMRLAGYPYDPVTQRGGYPNTVRYLALIDSSGQAAAEIYQQQLARIGIRLRIDVAGWPAFLAKCSRRRTVQMGTAAWEADFPDASDFFEPLLTSSSIQEEQSQNLAFFSNATLDRWIDEARHERDSNLRRRLFQRAEELVADEAPWALGYAMRYFELWHPYVHGYRPNPVMNQRIRDMWLDRAEQPRSAALGTLGSALPRFARTELGSRHRSTLALGAGTRP